MLRSVTIISAALRTKGQIMTDYIDLSGTWQLYLDSTGSGKTPHFNEDTMLLPGTTSAAGKGKANPARERGFLTDAYKFEGCVWFRRKVNTSGLRGKTVLLFLERTRITTVYFDAIKLKKQESLVAPHVYDLTKYITDGEHYITICVKNVGYKTGGGHLTSQDTQSNWCGITGKIELRVYNAPYIRSVKVTPLVPQRSFRISGEVTTRGKMELFCSAESIGQQDVHRAPEKRMRFDHGRFEFIYELGEGAKLWSPQSPNIYKLELRTETDYYTCTVGLREFKADKDCFRMNGRPVFLRGKHDGLVFPKTGYAPTDLDSWLRVMGKAKEWGINHYRFHTCCPPEAAFEAADRLGIIMEPQLPFWGTIREEGEEGYNKEEQDFLVSEGFEILRCFGNHPSFCMMSMGNELWGSQKELNRIIRGYKEYDPDKLYTQGSNNFQWFPAVLEEDDFFVGVRLAKDRLIRGSYAMCDAPQGHIQTDKPSTAHDYDAAVLGTAAHTEESAGSTVQIQFGTGVKTVEATAADGAFVPKVPVITHEIGQYETFPSFDEIEKYTGPLKPRNFEQFREDLDKAGLLPLWRDFFLCSGKLAAQCYKEELEAALRSATIAGFQLLDLQDFPGQGTALVGMLDAFMDSKKLIEPEEWRCFCNDVVLLARFDDYCIEAGQEFNARIDIADVSEHGVSGSKLLWKLSGGVEAEGSFEVEQSGRFTAGSISVPMPEVNEPVKFTLRLSLEGTDVYNSYDLMLYPKRENLEISDVRIFSELDDEAEALLAEGRTVLITPDTDDPEHYIEGTYCTDFWCYPMFRTISQSMGRPLPIGTMGLLIDKEHEMFRDFPTERWSTPQWWSVVTNSRSEILDGSSQAKRVIVRTIDNFERCHDLALMYEYEHNGGKVVVLNCDLEKLSESPEGRQFLYAVMKYCSIDK